MFVFNYNEQKGNIMKDIQCSQKFMWLPDHIITVACERS